jgi:hypothetical protein
LRPEAIRQGVVRWIRLGESDQALQGVPPISASTPHGAGFLHFRSSAPVLILFVEGEHGRRRSVRI